MLICLAKREGLARMTFRYRIARPPRRSRVLDYALTLAFFALLTAVVVRLDSIESIARAGIPHIVDGDTVLLDGVKIRMMGMDAPEIGQICASAKGPYDCGVEAKAQLRALIGREKVACQGWQRDKYQRLLARCTAGSRNLNRSMVEAGWAASYGDYLSEEAKARKAKSGIWAGAFDRPQEWRRMKGGASEPPHDIALTVKSYISALFYR